MTTIPESAQKNNYLESFKRLGLAQEDLIEDLISLDLLSGEINFDTQSIVLYQLLLLNNITNKFWLKQIIENDHKINVKIYGDEIDRSFTFGESDGIEYDYYDLLKFLQNKARILLPCEKWFPISTETLLHAINRIEKDGIGICNQTFFVDEKDLEEIEFEQMLPYLESDINNASLRSLYDFDEFDSQNHISELKKNQKWKELNQLEGYNRARPLHPKIYDQPNNDHFEIIQIPYYQLNICPNANHHSIPERTAPLYIKNIKQGDKLYTKRANCPKPGCDSNGGEWWAVNLQGENVQMAHVHREQFPYLRIKFDALIDKLNAVDFKTDQVECESSGFHRGTILNGCIMEALDRKPVSTQLQEPTGKNFRAQSIEIDTGYVFRNWVLKTTYDHVNNACASSRSEYPCSYRPYTAAELEYLKIIELELQSVLDPADKFHQYYKRVFYRRCQPILNQGSSTTGGIPLFVPKTQVIKYTSGTGCGKTYTSRNIAYDLAQKGYSVAIITATSKEKNRGNHWLWNDRKKNPFNKRVLYFTHEVFMLFNRYYYDYIIFDEFGLKHSGEIQLFSRYSVSGFVYVFGAEDQIRYHPRHKIDGKSCKYHELHIEHISESFLRDCWRCWPQIVFGLNYAFGQNMLPVHLQPEDQDNVVDNIDGQSRWFCDLSAANYEEGDPLLKMKLITFVQKEKPHFCQQQGHKHTANECQGNDFKKGSRVIYSELSTNNHIVNHPSFAYVACSRSNQSRLQINNIGKSPLLDRFRQGCQIWVDQQYNKIRDIDHLRNIFDLTFRDAYNVPFDSWYENSYKSEDLINALASLRSSHSSDPRFVELIDNGTNIADDRPWFEKFDKTQLSTSLIYERRMEEEHYRRLDDHEHDESCHFRTFKTIKGKMNFYYEHIVCSSVIICEFASNEKYIPPNNAIQKGMNPNCNFKPSSLVSYIYNGIYVHGPPQMNNRNKAYWLVDPNKVDELIPSIETQPVRLSYFESSTHSTQEFLNKVDMDYVNATIKLLESFKMIANSISMFEWLEKFVVKQCRKCFNYPCICSSKPSASLRPDRFVQCKENCDEHTDCQCERYHSKVSAIKRKILERQEFLHNNKENLTESTVNKYQNEIKSNQNKLQIARNKSKKTTKSKSQLPKSEIEIRMAEEHSSILQASNAFTQSRSESDKQKIFHHREVLKHLQQEHRKNQLENLFHACGDCCEKHNYQRFDSIINSHVERTSGPDQEVENVDIKTSISDCCIIFKKFGVGHSDKCVNSKFHQESPTEGQSLPLEKQGSIDSQNSKSDTKSQNKNKNKLNNGSAVLNTQIASNDRSARHERSEYFYEGTLTDTIYNAINNGYQTFKCDKIYRSSKPCNLKTRDLGLVKIHSGFKTFIAFINNNVIKIRHLRSSDNVQLGNENPEYRCRNACNFSSLTYNSFKSHIDSCNKHFRRKFENIASDDDSGCPKNPYCTLPDCDGKHAKNHNAGSSKKRKSKPKYFGRSSGFNSGDTNIEIVASLRSTVTSISNQEMHSINGNISIILSLIILLLPLYLIISWMSSGYCHQIITEALHIPHLNERFPKTQELAQHIWKHYTGVDCYIKYTRGYFIHIESVSRYPLPGYERIDKFLLSPSNFNIPVGVITKYITKQINEIVLKNLFKRKPVSEGVIILYTGHGKRKYKNVYKWRKDRYSTKVEITMDDRKSFNLVCYLDLEKYSNCLPDIGSLSLHEYGWSFRSYNSRYFKKEGDLENQKIDGIDPIRPSRSRRIKISASLRSLVFDFKKNQKKRRIFIPRIPNPLNQLEVEEYHDFTQRERNKLQHILNGNISDFQKENPFLFWFMRFSMHVLAYGMIYMYITIEFSFASFIPLSIFLVTEYMLLLRYILEFESNIFDRWLYEQGMNELYTYKHAQTLSPEKQIEYFKHRHENSKSYFDLYIDFLVSLQPTGDKWYNWLLYLIYWFSIINIKNIILGGIFYGIEEIYWIFPELFHLFYWSNYINIMVFKYLIIDYWHILYILYFVSIWYILLIWLFCKHYMNPESIQKWYFVKRMKHEVWTTNCFYIRFMDSKFKQFDHLSKTFKTQYRRCRVKYPGKMGRYIWESRNKFRQFPDQGGCFTKVMNKRASLRSRFIHVYWTEHYLYRQFNHVSVKPLDIFGKHKRYYGWFINNKPLFTHETITVWELIHEYRHLYIFNADWDEYEKTGVNLSNPEIESIFRNYSMAFGSSQPNYNFGFKTDHAWKLAQMNALTIGNLIKISKLKHRASDGKFYRWLASEQIFNNIVKHTLKYDLTLGEKKRDYVEATEERIRALHFFDRHRNPDMVIFSLTANRQWLHSMSSAINFRLQRNELTLDSINRFLNSPPNYRYVINEDNSITTRLSTDPRDPLIYESCRQLLLLWKHELERESEHYHASSEDCSHYLINHPDHQHTEEHENIHIGRPHRNNKTFYGSPDWYLNIKHGKTYVTHLEIVSRKYGTQVYQFTPHTIRLTEQTINFLRALTNQIEDAWNLQQMFKQFGTDLETAGNDWSTLQMCRTCYAIYDKDILTCPNGHTFDSSIVIGETNIERNHNMYAELDKHASLRSCNKTCNHVSYDSWNEPYDYPNVNTNTHIVSHEEPSALAIWVKGPVSRSRYVWDGLHYPPHHGVMSTDLSQQSRHDDLRDWLPSRPDAPWFRFWNQNQVSILPNDFNAPLPDPINLRTVQSDVLQLEYINKYNGWLKEKYLELFKYESFKPCPLTKHSWCRHLHRSNYKNTEVFKIGECNGFDVLIHDYAIEFWSKECIPIHNATLPVQSLSGYLSNRSIVQHDHRYLVGNPASTARSSQFLIPANELASFKPLKHPNYTNEQFSETIDNKFSYDEYSKIFKYIADWCPDGKKIGDVVIGNRYYADVFGQNDNLCVGVNFGSKENLIYFGLKEISDFNNGFLSNDELYFYRQPFTQLSDINFYLTKPSEISNLITIPTNTYITYASLRSYSSSAPKEDIVVTSRSNYKYKSYQTIVGIVGYNIDNEDLFQYGQYKHCYHVGYNQLYKGILLNSGHKIVAFKEYNNVIHNFGNFDLEDDLMVGLLQHPSRIKYDWEFKLIKILYETIMDLGEPVNLSVSYRLNKRCRFCSDDYANHYVIIESKNYMYSIDASEFSLMNKDCSDWNYLNKTFSNSYHIYHPGFAPRYHNCKVFVSSNSSTLTIPANKPLIDFIEPKYYPKNAKIDFQTSNPEYNGKYDRKPNSVRRGTCKTCKCNEVRCILGDCCDCYFTINNRKSDEFLILREKTYDEKTIASLRSISFFSYSEKTKAALKIMATHNLLIKIENWKWPDLLMKVYQPDCPVIKISECNGYDVIYFNDIIQLWNTRHLSDVTFPFQTVTNYMDFRSVPEIDHRWFLPNFRLDEANIIIDAGKILNDRLTHTAGFNLGLSTSKVDKLLCNCEHFNEKRAKYTRDGKMCSVCFIKNRDQLNEYKLSELYSLTIDKNIKEDPNNNMTKHFQNISQYSIDTIAPYIIRLICRDTITATGVIWRQRAETDYLIVSASTKYMRAGDMTLSLYIKQSYNIKSISFPFPVYYDPTLPSKCIGDVIFHLERVSDENIELPPFKSYQHTPVSYKNFLTHPHYNLEYNTSLIHVGTFNKWTEPCLAVAKDFSYFAAKTPDWWPIVGPIYEITTRSFHKLSCIPDGQVAPAFNVYDYTVQSINNLDFIKNVAIQIEPCSCTDYQVELTGSTCDGIYCFKCGGYFITTESRLPNKPAFIQVPDNGGKTILLNVFKKYFSYTDGTTENPGPINTFSLVQPVANQSTVLNNFYLSTCRFKDETLKDYSTEQFKRIRYKPNEFASVRSFLFWVRDWLQTETGEVVNLTESDVRCRCCDRPNTVILEAISLPQLYKCECGEFLVRKQQHEEKTLFWKPNLSDITHYLPEYVLDKTSFLPAFYSKQFTQKQKDDLYILYTKDNLKFTFDSYDWCEQHEMIDTRVNTSVKPIRIGEIGKFDLIYYNQEIQLWSKLCVPFVNPELSIPIYIAPRINRSCPNHMHGWTHDRGKLYQKFEKGSLTTSYQLDVPFEIIKFVNKYYNGFWKPGYSKIVIDNKYLDCGSAIIVDELTKFCPVHKAIHKKHIPEPIEQYYEDYQQTPAYLKKIYKFEFHLMKFLTYIGLATMVPIANAYNITEELQTTVKTQVIPIMGRTVFVTQDFMNTQIEKAFIYGQNSINLASLRSKFIDLTIDQYNNYFWFNFSFITFIALTFLLKKPIRHFCWLLVSFFHFSSYYISIQTFIYTYFSFFLSLSGFSYILMGIISLYIIIFKIGFMFLPDFMNINRLLPELNDTYPNLTESELPYPTDPNIDLSKTTYYPTVGTHGDRIPILYLARLHAHFGAYHVHVHHIQSTTPEELVKLADGNVGVLVFAFLSLSTSHFTRYGNIFQPHVDPKYGASYSCAPSHHYIENMKFTSKNKLWFLPGLLTEFVTILFNPHLRIQNLIHGTIPRSCDGKTLMRKYKNTGAPGSIAWCVGSSTVDDVPLEIREKYPQIKAPYHYSEFAKYETIYTHGGAGTVQALTACGCKFIVVSPYLDRIYRAEFKDEQGRYDLTKYYYEPPITYFLGFLFLSGLPNKIPWYFKIQSFRYYFCLGRKLITLLFLASSRFYTLIYICYTYHHIVIASILSIPLLLDIFTMRGADSIRFGFIAGIWKFPILGTIQGWGSFIFAILTITQTFDKIIHEMAHWKYQRTYLRIIKRPGIPLPFGHVYLYDGVTGDRFEGLHIDTNGFFERFKFFALPFRQEHRPFIDIPLPFSPNYLHRVVKSAKINPYSAFFNCHTVTIKTIYENSALTAGLIFLMYFLSFIVVLLPATISFYIIKRLNIRIYNIPLYDEANQNADFKTPEQLLAFAAGDLEFRCDDCKQTFASMRSKDNHECSGCWICGYVEDLHTWTTSHCDKHRISYEKLEQKRLNKKGQIHIEEPKPQQEHNAKDDKELHEKQEELRNDPTFPQDKIPTSMQELRQLEEQSISEFYSEKNVLAMLATLYHCALTTNNVNGGENICNYTEDEAAHIAIMTMRKYLRQMKLPTKTKYAPIPPSCYSFIHKSKQKFIMKFYSMLRHVLNINKQISLMVHYFMKYIRKHLYAFKTVFWRIFSMLLIIGQIVYGVSLVIWQQLFFVVSYLIEGVFGKSQARRLKSIWALSGVTKTPFLSWKLLLETEMVKNSASLRSDFLSDYDNYVNSLKENAIKNGVKGKDLDIGGPQRRNINFSKPLMTKEEAEIHGFNSDEYVTTPENDARVRKYIEQFQTNMGSDGVFFSVNHQQRIIDSDTRYVPKYSPLNPEDRALAAEIARGMVAEYPNALANNKLTLPEQVKVYIKSKYAPGTPFLNIYKSRQQMFNAGWDETFIKQTYQSLLNGEYPVQFYHSFVKSQVVDINKVANCGKNLRTVVAQDLSSYWIDQCIQMERNKRLVWRECGAGMGMVLNQNMEYLFTQLRDLKKEKGGSFFEADASEYDSRTSPFIYEVLSQLAVQGWKDHPNGANIASVMASKYESMANCWIMGITRNQFDSITIGIPDESLRSSLIKRYPDRFISIEEAKIVMNNKDYANKIVLTNDAALCYNVIDTPDKKSNELDIDAPFYTYMTTDRDFRAEDPVTYRDFGNCPNKLNVEYFDNERDLIEALLQYSKNEVILAQVTPKNRGMGTGQSATSWDNTWGFKAAMIAGWMRYFDYRMSVEEFFKKNKLFNTGDDSGWATKIRKDQVNLQKLKDCFAYYGIHLEMEFKQNLNELGYLGKYCRVPTAQDSLDLRNWRHGVLNNVNSQRKWYEEHTENGVIKFPELVVYQSPAALLLRRTSLRYYQSSIKYHLNLVTQLQRTVGHMQIAAFNPELYQLLAQEYIEDITHYANIMGVTNFSAKLVNQKQQLPSGKMLNIGLPHIEIKTSESISRKAIHRLNEWYRSSMPKNKSLGFIKNIDYDPMVTIKELQQTASLRSGTYRTGRQKAFYAFLYLNKPPSYYEVMSIHLKPETRDQIEYANRFWAKIEKKSYNPEFIIRQVIDIGQMWIGEMPRQYYKMTPNLLAMYPEDPFPLMNKWVEKFIWMKHIQYEINEETGEKIVTAEIQDLQAYMAYINMSPYGAVCDGSTFFQEVQEGEYRKEVLKHEVWVYANMTILTTLVYIGLYPLERILLRVPWFGTFYRLLMFYLIDIPKLYSIVGLANWHTTAESDRLLSAIMPKDPYIQMKRFSNFIVDFVPIEVGYILPFYFILKFMIPPIKSFVLLLNSGMTFRKTNGSTEKFTIESFKNPWDEEVKPHTQIYNAIHQYHNLPHNERKTEFILSSPTATGKSTLFLYALQTNYKMLGFKDVLATKKRRVTHLLVPRLILRDEYSLPFLENSFGNCRIILDTSNADHFKRTFKQELKPMHLPIDMNTTIASLRSIDPDQDPNYDQVNYKVPNYPELHQPENLIVVSTYGHFIQRCKMPGEIQKDDIILMDEFHELSGEMIACMEVLNEQRSSKQRNLKFLMSATPVNLSFISPQIIHSKVQQRFGKTIYKRDDSPVNNYMWARDQFPEYADSTIIMVNTYDEINEVIDALSYNNIVCQEVSARTKGTDFSSIPSKTVLVCSQIITAGITLPGRKLMVDCGTLIKNMRGRLEKSWSDPDSVEQIGSRVGRNSDGIVIRPTLAGTGSIAVPYPSGSYFSYNYVASHFQIPRLLSFSKLSVPDNITSLETYYTESKLAKTMISDIDELLGLAHKSVYEPCCGNGSLTKEIASLRPFSFDCNDIKQHENINKIKNIDNYYIGDLRRNNKKYDVIIANPPFGADKNLREYSIQLHEHLLRQTRQHLVLMNTPKGIQYYIKRWSHLSYTKVGTYKFKLPKQYEHHKLEYKIIDVEIAIFSRTDFDDSIYHPERDDAFTYPHNVHNMNKTFEKNNYNSEYFSFIGWDTTVLKTDQSHIRQLGHRTIIDQDIVNQFKCVALLGFMSFQGIKPNQISTTYNRYTAGIFAEHELIVSTFIKQNRIKLLPYNIFSHLLLLPNLFITKFTDNHIKIPSPSNIQPYNPYINETLPYDSETHNFEYYLSHKFIYPIGTGWNSAIRDRTIHVDNKIQYDLYRAKVRSEILHETMKDTTESLQSDYHIAIRKAQEDWPVFLDKNKNRSLKYLNQRFLELTTKYYKEIVKSKYPFEGEDHKDDDDHKDDHPF